MFYTRRIYLPFIFVLLLVLSACGGGGGSDSTPSGERTGILLDSPVVGIHYDSQPSGKSGTTGPGGEYDYLVGDTVTFSIGDLVFPPVTAAAVITPLTLAGATSITDQQATNIAIMLQSLDDDPTDDVITIKPGASASATVVNFNQSTAAFITDLAVINLMSDTNSTLVDAGDAQAHVTESIVNNGGTTVTDASIVGAWDAGWNSTTPGMLIFYANGFYIYWDTVSSDPSCAPGGVEYGSYSYDGSTIVTSQQVDENNSCGLSSSPALALTISGDQMNIDGTMLSRIDGGADSLVGAWDVGASTSNPFGLVFYPDGFFIHWETTNDNPSCAPGGVEYGTYTYNPSNANGLSVSVIMDENGSCGTSGVPQGNTIFHVSGDALTSVDSETFTLNRVGGSSSSSIVGAWDAGWNSTTPGMLIFYENGFFIHWQDASDNPSCAPGGVEYGTYTYNPANANGLSVNVILDENGSCGTSGVPQGNTIFHVSGDALTSADHETFTLSRIDGGADSLVGAWDVGASTSDPFGLVFYPNGFFIHWQNANNNPDCAPGGVEYGTYTYNPANANGLSVSVIMDENGSCGTSGVPQGNTIFHVSGDALTSVDSETFTLNRVGGSSSSSIVGAWDAGWNSTTPGMLIFYENGFFIHWQDASDNPSCAPGGVEYGTYTYNPANANGLSVNVILDENGSCGTSGVPQGNTIFHVSGDALTSADHETFTLNRVGG